MILDEFSRKYFAGFGRSKNEQKQKIYKYNKKKRKWNWKVKAVRSDNVSEFTNE